MSISPAEVEHVARLAHVGLEPAEIEELCKQLTSVLEHIAKLQQVDTSDVDPTSLAVATTNVVREDVVAPSWPVEAELANAPHRAEDFFEVQAVFE